MKIYTGVDIIEVSRIQENIEKYGEKFLKKIFTNKEIEYCESKKSQKIMSYAGRFAGKEATFKAISALLNNKFEIGWQDIEILNDSNGKPTVSVGILHSHQINYDIDISISHVKEMAIASVSLICF